MKNHNTFSELARPAHARGWRVESRVRAVAGTLILASVGLAVFVSPWWLLLTSFVGLNLIQSSLTGWCLMSNIIGLAFPALSKR